MIGGGKTRDAKALLKIVWNCSPKPPIPRSSNRKSGLIISDLKKRKKERNEVGFEKGEWKRKEEKKEKKEKKEKRKEIGDEIPF